MDLIFKDKEEKIKYHYILPQSDVRYARWFSKRELRDLKIPEMSREVIVKAFANRSKHTMNSEPK